MAAARCPAGQQELAAAQPAQLVCSLQGAQTASWLAVVASRPRRMAAGMRQLARLHSAQVGETVRLCECVAANRQHTESEGRKSQQH
jgi:hypothetical protein